MVGVLLILLAAILDDAQSSTLNPQYFVPSSSFIPGGSASSPKPFLVSPANNFDGSNSVGGNFGNGAGSIVNPAGILGSTSNFGANVNINSGASGSVSGNQNFGASGFSGNQNNFGGSFISSHGGSAALLGSDRKFASGITGSNFGASNFGDNSLGNTGFGVGGNVFSNTGSGAGGSISIGSSITDGSGTSLNVGADRNTGLNSNSGFGPQIIFNQGQARQSLGSSFSTSQGNINFGRLQGSQNFVQQFDQITLTVTETVTIDSFVTVTETVLNSVPVTITGFNVNTVTVTTRGVHQTSANDVVVLTSTIEERPSTVFVTTAKSNFVQVTQVSVSLYTIVHSAQLIDQTTFTTVLTQTLTLSSPIVRTSISTSVQISTAYQTIVNTVFVPGYNH